MTTQPVAVIRGMREEMMSTSKIIELAMCHVMSFITIAVRKLNVSTLTCSFQFSRVKLTIVTPAAVSSDIDVGTIKQSQ